MDNNGNAVQPPEWIVANYPQLSSVVHPVAQLLREYAGKPSVEVEFRLGLRVGGAWSSNVGFGVQDCFLKKCTTEFDRTCPSALCFNQWREHADYSFDAGVKIGEVRTRVEYDTDACTVRSQTVRKRLLQRIEVSILDTPYAIRVDACQEQPLDDKHIPEAVNPSRVALKHRCSAHHTPRESTHPMWRYDLTVLWSGPSRTDAEIAQADTEVAPEYIVEIEYVGNRDDLSRFGADYVALSAIIKVADVVGRMDSPVALFSPANALPRSADLTIDER